MQERPRSGLEFLFCALAGASALGAAGWLLVRQFRGPDAYSSHEVIGAVCLAALAAYLGYLAWQLRTCAYSLEGHLLTLAQGAVTLEIDLRRVRGLHRWKPRWIWFQALKSDLGLPHVDTFPPLWFFRDYSIYVLVYRDDHGEETAVAFRPSSRLLHVIRDYLVEKQGPIEDQLAGKS
jgi:hypothetical protein